ncbi:MAG: hypothetical protein P1U74_05055 [Legionellaceae bacterium]|nr:hypothetical protein [Legionellaceae bacterium]
MKLTNLILTGALALAVPAVGFCAATGTNHRPIPEEIAPTNNNQDQYSNHKSVNSQKVQMVRATTTPRKRK